MKTYNQFIIETTKTLQKVSDDPIPEFYGGIILPNGVFKNVEFSCDHYDVIEREFGDGSYRDFFDEGGIRLVFPNENHLIASNDAVFEIEFDRYKIAKAKNSLISFMKKMTPKFKKIVNFEYNINLSRYDDRLTQSEKFYKTKVLNSAISFVEKNAKKPPKTKTK